MEDGQLQEELSAAPTLGWAIGLAAEHQVRRFRWGNLSVRCTYRDEILTSVRTSVILVKAKADGMGSPEG